MGHKGAVKVSRAQMAVAVAEDVVKRLSGRKLNMAHVYMSATIPLPLPYITHGCSLQPVVNKLEKDCRVCAIGAAALSFVRLYDNATWDNVISRQWLNRAYIENTLRPAFSQAQLNKIENAYENLDGKWYKKYPDDRKRAKAIFQNIVRNGGTFKSDDLPEE